MKLIISIVSDKDVQPLLEKLIKNGYRATKLSSTGGFLREGNTTLLMGVDEEKVEDVIGLIGETCQSRERFVTPIPPMPGFAEPFIPFPVKVTVGGATVFVLDVEKSVKV